MVLKVKGRKVLIDTADLDKVKAFSPNSIQLMHNDGKRDPHAVIKKEGKTYQLGRVIMGLTGKKDAKKRVIFINQNTLDLQRDNLKVVTLAEAAKRKTKQGGKSSKYLGVHFSNHHGKYRAVIKPSTKKGNQHLGFFVDEDEAALAYNEAATKAFGPLAVLNDVKAKKSRKKKDAVK